MRWVIATVSCLLALIAACTTFGKSDDTQPADAGAEGSEATAPPGTPPPDPNALIDDTFETPGDCGGWELRTGATFTWVAGAGRNGGGACLATLPPFAQIHNGVDVTDGGSFELTAWVRGIDGGKAYGVLGTVLPDGGPGPNATNVVDLDTASKDYALLQMKLSSTPPITGLDLILEGNDQGVSYYVDDIRLVKK
jgi:hypothetical protein